MTINSGRLQPGWIIHSSSLDSLMLMDPSGSSLYNVSSAACLQFHNHDTHSQFKRQHWLVWPTFLSPEQHWAACVVWKQFVFPTVHQEMVGEARNLDKSAVNQNSTQSLSLHSVWKRAVVDFYPDESDMIRMWYLITSASDIQIQTFHRFKQEIWFDV